MLAATLQRLPGLRPFAPNATTRPVVKPARQPAHSPSHQRAGRYPGDVFRAWPTNRLSEAQATYLPLLPGQRLSSPGRLAFLRFPTPPLMRRCRLRLRRGARYRRGACTDLRPFQAEGSTCPADNSRFDSQPGLPSSSEFCAGLSRPSRLVPREGLAKAASTFAASSCSRLPGLSCLNPENIRMTHRLRERAIRAAVPTLRFRRNPTGSSGNFAGLSRLSGSACRRGLQRLATAVGGNRPRCYGHHQSLETVGGEPHQPNPQCCALSRPG